MTADLILLGRIWTGDSKRPRAQAIAAIGGRVVAVGSESEVRVRCGPRTEVFGDPSVVIVPGFVDAHLHFMALARRAAETDCSPAACPSAEAIVSRLAEAALARPGGVWIRAFGYDERWLPGGQPPSLAAIDRVTPGHPIRLLHRTGHAAILNSAALRELGLLESSRIERDGHGRPTGLVYEPGPLLRGGVPGPTAEELAPLCENASRKLLAAGVTTFHDPTPGQGRGPVAALRSLTESGRIRQRVRWYGAPDATGSAADAEPDRFRRGGVKLLLDEASDPEQFLRELGELDGAGVQVAVHAVEGGALAVAVEGFRRLGHDRVRSRRHRIEHAALCPPVLAGELAATGASVVTHPDFLRRFARRYRAEIANDELGWLYPLRDFLDRGIRVGFGSDGPIVPPDPLANVAAAVERIGDDGEPLAPGQAITAAEGLALHTFGSAAVAGDESRMGRLRPGALADAVVLEADPTVVRASEIRSIPIRATVVGGQVEWTA